MYIIVHIHMWCDWQHLNVYWFTRRCLQRIFYRVSHGHSFLLYFPSNIIAVFYYTKGLSPCMRWWKVIFLFKFRSLADKTFILYWLVWEEFHLFLTKCLRKKDQIHRSEHWNILYTTCTYIIFLPVWMDNSKCIQYMWIIVIYH